jgi:putative endonuclease
MKVYYTYIMASSGGTLYTGVTKKYNVVRLVYFEQSNSIYDAINREKQIKGWTRRKKIQLIQKMNPKWRDLAEEWY